MWLGGDGGDAGGKAQKLLAGGPGVVFVREGFGLNPDEFVLGRRVDRIAELSRVESRVVRGMAVFKGEIVQGLADAFADADFAG